MQISAHGRLHSPQKGFQRPQTNIKRKTYPPTHEPAQPQALDLLPVLGTCGRARECLPAGESTQRASASYSLLMKSMLWDLSVTEQQKHLGSPSLPTQEPRAPSTPPRAPGCGSSRGHAVTAPSQSHRKGKTLRTNSRHVLPPVQDAPGVGRPQGTPRPSEGPHHPPSVSHTCSSISPMRIVVTTAPARTSTGSLLS